MAEGREEELAAILADRADHIAHRAGVRVGAFEQGEITVGGGAQQRLEIGAGMVGNAHGRSPASVSASHSPV